MTEGTTMVEHQDRSKGVQSGQGPVQASGLAELRHVPNESPKDDSNRLALRLLKDLMEKAVRKDLGPVEQAQAYRALMDLNGWSGSQLARELSIHQTTVAKILTLLELPESVRQQVEQGALPASVAYEVGKIEDVAVQAEVANRVVAEGLSRAETIEAVRTVRGTSKPKRGGGQRATARTLRTSTGHRITIEHCRGIDDAGILAACQEVVSQLETKLRRDSDAA